MLVQEFDRLNKEDFENKDILDDIRESLKEREILLVRDFKRIANDSDLIKQYEEKLKEFQLNGE